MLIKKTFKSNEFVEVNRVGSNLAIIRAELGLRVRAINNKGQVTLDTEIYQGINLTDLDYIKLEFSSDVDQQLIFWCGPFKYSFETQSNRAKSIDSKQVALRHGVNKLLEIDPPRVRTVINSPVDIWLGGNEMVSGNGLVSNGRMFKANTEIELTNFGEVFYWVTDEASRVFKEYETRAKYAQNNGRTALEANGVPYFDIDVPPELDGVPLNLKARVRHKSRGVDGLGDQDYTNISVTPAFYITIGDETTETLTKHTSYGATGTHNGYEFDDKTLDVTVILSAGVHRVFPVESELDFDATQVVGHDWYGDSFTTFIKIYSDDPLLTIKGHAQILEERS